MSSFTLQTLKVEGFSHILWTEFTDNNRVLFFSGTIVVWKLPFSQYHIFPIKYGWWLSSVLSLFVLWYNRFFLAPRHTYGAEIQSGSFGTILLANTQTLLSIVYLCNDRVTIQSVRALLAGICVILWTGHSHCVSSLLDSYSVSCLFVDNASDKPDKPEKEELWLYVCLCVLLCLCKLSHECVRAVHRYSDALLLGHMGNTNLNTHTSRSTVPPLLPGICKVIHATHTHTHTKFLPVVVWDPFGRLQTLEAGLCSPASPFSHVRRNDTQRLVKTWQAPTVLHRPLWNTTHRSLICAGRAGWTLNKHSNSHQLAQVMCSSYFLTEAEVKKCCWAGWMGPSHGSSMKCDLAFYSRVRPGWWWGWIKEEPMIHRIVFKV